MVGWSVGTFGMGVTGGAIIFGVGKERGFFLLQILAGNIGRHAVDRVAGIANEWHVNQAVELLLLVEVVGFGGKLSGRNMIAVIGVLATGRVRLSADFGWLIDVHNLG